MDSRAIALALLLAAPTGSAQVFPSSSRLVAADAAGGDLVGRSVGIDGSTVVTGAPRHDAPGCATTDCDEGAAYVFVRAAGGNGYVEQAGLTAASPAPGDEFGFAVTISRDTICVGAPGDDSAADGAGAVHVFVRSGTTWSLEQVLTASDALADARFGSTLDLEGDQLVVGAPQDDASCPGVSGCNSGAVYVFLRSGTTWTESAKVFPFSGASSDLFGAAVELDGDTLLVGASAAASGGVFRGAAYAFVGFGAAWIEQEQFVPADLNDLSFFGSALAKSGERILIGAPGDDDLCAGALACQAGAVYSYSRIGSNWTFEEKFRPADGSMLDFFGASVALSGDRAFVGAPNDDDASSEAGSVYAWVRTDTAWEETGELFALVPGLDHDYGIDLALDRDRLVVAAPGPTTLSALPPPFVFTDDGAADVRQFEELAPVFCFGDGGVAGCSPCPCGNDAPSGTVGGCINSAGRSARLHGDGTPSLSRDDLSFGLTDGSTSSFAVLISASFQLPSSAANPCFGQASGVQSVNLDGLRCAGANVQRHGARQSDPNGDVGVTTNGWGNLAGAANAILAQGAFFAGETRHFQAFYRDLDSAVCATGQNTSQGWSVTLEP